MERVARKRREAEVFVKRPGFIVLGVNRERTNTGDIRGLQRSLHRVLEQPRPKAFALPRCRDGQPGEEHDRNGITGEALDEAFGRCGIFDLADDKRVVTGDNIIGEGNVGLGSACLLVLERITRKKPVEGFPAAIEFIDVVAAEQLFNSEWGQSTPPRSKTLFSFKSFVSRRAGWGGAESAAWKASH